IDWLIKIGAQAFANHKPAVACKSRARFLQAKQEILGDMHHVNSVYQIEFTRVDALSVPWQIQVERAPFEWKARILPREFALATTQEERVRLCDKITFHPRQKPAFVK